MRTIYNTQKRVTRKSTLIAFVIVVAFVILGKFIFELFGITIPALLCLLTYFFFLISDKLVIVVVNKIISVIGK